MPAIPLTTAGENRLLTSGAQPTHLQFGSITLDPANWAARTTVPGAFTVIDITEAVEGSQLQLTGVDDDDAAAYTNFAALGAWIGDPVDPGSTLMALGTAAAGETYGDKSLNIDLEVAGTIGLTAAQMGNVTLSIAVLLNATETRFGKATRATQADAEGGTNNVGFMTALRTNNWWDALWTTLSVPATKLTGFIPVGRFGNNSISSAKILSLMASKITGVLPAAGIPQLPLSRVDINVLVPSRWREHSLEFQQR